MDHALLLLVFLAAFALMVKYALHLASLAKDETTRRHATIAVLVVAIVVLAVWLFGPWPLFPLRRLT